MAIEQTNAAAHSGHQAPRTSGPEPAKPSFREWQMPSDSYRPSAKADTQERAPSPAAAPESAPAKDGSKLAGLANLGRLQHGMHLLAPVGNLAKGAGQMAKAPGALGAAQVASHAHHSMDAAKAVSGGFLVRMGGPLSAIATGLSAVVAVFDIKRAVGVLKDPQATSKDKTLSTTQAALSGASGATGLLAAAGALGLALPFGIPALLTLSTVTGLASFAVSLFNRKPSHQGH